jgi:hypothetical protein
MYLNRFRALLLVVSLLALAMNSSANASLFQRESPIVSEAFTIAPGKYAWFRFGVPDSGGNVVGRFRASGGGGNDVEVYILDEDGFENFKNGHRVQTYYNSGRVTVANINISLSSGTYYLIFSNTFSAVSNKAVNGRVALRY